MFLFKIYDVQIGIDKLKDKSMLSAYERDLVDIKMGTIKELAKTFHTTAGYLIDGERVELDEDIMQVAMILQEMQVELRKVAVEQVKVLAGLEDIVKGSARV